jgi:pyruvate,water dikinase
VETSPDKPDTLEDASSRIRALFSAGTIPDYLANELRASYGRLGERAVAVRSSATAEDLPELSFAGQQDTYLNVVGTESLFKAVVDCWSSLWTARAIGYRERNGVLQNDLALGVVVQAMVQSQASGVLFTANLLTGLRTEMVIDAALGLGEALVSGQVEPDHYVVDPTTGRILTKTMGSKTVSIHGKAGGGTQGTEHDRGEVQALPDEQILALARMESG